MKQAWLEILAAHLDVKVAKASFTQRSESMQTLGLPVVRSAQAGVFSASLVYGLAADLMVPLINRKAITANYFSANSRELQAVYHYERAILSGFVEVSKLLSMVYNLEQSYNLKTQEVEKLTQSIDISGRLFSSARADYMEVLLTRRDALEAQLELIENKSDSSWPRSVCTVRSAAAGAKAKPSFLSDGAAPQKSYRDSILPAKSDAATACHKRIERSVGFRFAMKPRPHKSHSRSQHRAG